MLIVMLDKQYKENIHGLEKHTCYLFAQAMMSIRIFMAKLFAMISQHKIYNITLRLIY
jgi:hypothetical protein